MRGLTIMGPHWILRCARLSWRWGRELGCVMWDGRVWRVRSLGPVTLLTEVR